VKKQGLGINAHDVGLGSTLKQNLLLVPPNQRSYAWEETHVQTLFDDLSAAIQSDAQPYFLGTLVLTQGEGDRLEVADGQQRLATTSILISAVRDYLETLGSSEKKAAAKYTSDYLLEYDVMTGENTPRLLMNYEDNLFFTQQILISSSETSRTSSVPESSSHQRLYNAAAVARRHVANVVSQFGKPETQAKELYRWIDFITNNAMVIAIKVPDSINAYTMFETLNDRGLRASQTDILKNFYFGRAGDRLSEMQHKWASMAATIESVGSEDLLITYLRHHWTLTHGYTAERELAALVKNEVTGRQQALSLVSDLDNLSTDYAGLQNPIDYIGWNNVDKETRAYIYIITRILEIEQILPLLLAVIKKFSSDQTKAAMRMFLSWSVRFLVAGSGGGGPLDRAYGELSRKVHEGQITTAKQLREQVRPGVLRTDAEFQQAFSKARVTKAVLYRYYLRAVEAHMQGAVNPDLGGTLDESFAYNAEHIMPQRESADWPIAEQTAMQFRRRLGNMVLLNPEQNMRLGNKAFDVKKAVYASCPLLLTQRISEYSTWGPAEIDLWQARMAEMAVKIWTA
jgi:hypothetical protein